MKNRVHAIAGVIGLLTILTFWTSTIVTELIGSHEMIATAKGLILKGMFILVPAMAIVGASGASLGAGRTDHLVSVKKKRMPIIAANGLLILLPMAFILEAKASAGSFDAWFYGLQGIELIAGATNITLMFLNARDGIRLTGRNGAQQKTSLLGRDIVATDTLALRLSKPAGFRFEPGQAMRLTIPVQGEKKATETSRIFSIASAPHEDHLTVVTRLRDSAYKRALQSLSVGQDLLITGPLGNFTLQDDPGRPAVFLAGGIGVTPFLSMIQHATQTDQPIDVTLFYANRTSAGMAMLSDLQKADATDAKFHLVATVTDPLKGDTWNGETGRIDKAMLARHLTDLRAPIYYCVGPSSFTKAMGDMLAAAGIDSKDIRLEQFSGY